MMKKIVLDIQNNIHTHTIERMLMQELDDCRKNLNRLNQTTALNVLIQAQKAVAE